MPEPGSLAGSAAGFVAMLAGAVAVAAADVVATSAAESAVDSAAKPAADSVAKPAAANSVAATAAALGCSAVDVTVGSDCRWTAGCFALNRDLPGLETATEFIPKSS